MLEREPPSVCECDAGFIGTHCQLTEIGRGEAPPLPLVCQDDEPGCPSHPAFSREFQRYGWTEASFPSGILGREVNVLIYHPSCDPSDPSDPNSAACTCLEDDAECWVDGQQYPLVLMMHGVGHDYTGYIDLMRHLALNGFVAASIDYGPLAIPPLADQERRSAVIPQMLQGIRVDWKNASRVDPQLHLFGHSRGGEAVIRAAQLLSERRTTLPLVVQSVLALAPSDIFCTGRPEDCTALSGEMTKGFLVVLGSHDDDVDGQGIRHYDRAGLETSVFGDEDQDLVKDMIWIHGADHNGFHCPEILPQRALPRPTSCDLRLPVDPESLCTSGECRHFPQDLSEDSHHVLLRNAATSFFKWMRCRDEACLTSYPDGFQRAFFAGDASLTADVPAHDSGTTAMVQHHEGSGHGTGPSGRRVIDNFQTEPVDCDGAGQPACWEISSSSGEVAVRQGAFAETPLQSPLGPALSIPCEVSVPPPMPTLRPECPCDWEDVCDETLHATVNFHQTNGLVATWDGGAPVLEFTIPAEDDSQGPLRDLREFTHLSLRIAQTFEGPGNVAEEPQRLRVVIRDGDGRRSSHTVTAQPPDTFEVAAVRNNLERGDYSQTVFSTARIPLILACRDIDLENVTSIDLALDRSGSSAGQLILDSLEFTSSPADQFDLSECAFVCGNGVREEGEACDGADLNDETCETQGFGGGTLSCIEDCTFDTSQCEECEPGTPACRCLDTSNPGEGNPALPNGGIFADGKWCLDDVAFGGTIRCVEEREGEAICRQCDEGQGVWCHCTELNQPCTVGVFGGPATGEATEQGVCKGACSQIPGPGECEPELGHGYCFISGEPDPLEGGIPEWFFYNYCSIRQDDLMCVNDGRNECRMETGPPCQ